MTLRARLEPASKNESYVETLALSEADTGTPIKQAELVACAWSYRVFPPGNSKTPILDLSTTADVGGDGVVSFSASPAQMSGLATATYEVRASFTFDGYTQEILRAQLPVTE